MKVLIVGSGGREHALAWAVSRSKRCGKLYAAPGNAGIATVAECIDLAADDIAGIVSFARNNKIDLVVIGPEAPLVAGLADQLQAAGIRAFGPSAKAAEIEGSKGFMKDLCARAGVPTARFRRFDEPDDAKEYIHAQGAPIVVKADGLAAGKGVIVCRNDNEAFAAVDHIMTERAFGGAGAEVVIEEFLEGEEASFFALVDGTRAVPLLSAQDHKAALDGDEGPNTGGMGAYAPAPIIDAAMTETIMATIVTPVIEEMARQDRPYSGVLFAGLMITRDGPKVIEFNARFGDPECQALMSLLESDILDALVAAAEGRLDEIELKWKPGSALTVVMAAHGYPGRYEKNTVIKNVDAAEAMKDVTVFHAGTSSADGLLLATGGRVLGVTATGKDVAAAQRKAYAAVEAIDWPDGFYRSDIGWRAVKN